MDFAWTFSSKFRISSIISRLFIFLIHVPDVRFRILIFNDQRFEIYTFLKLYLDAYSFLWDKRVCLLDFPHHISFTNFVYRFDICKMWHVFPCVSIYDFPRVHFSRWKSQIVEVFRGVARYFRMTRATGAVLMVHSKDWTFKIFYFPFRLSLISQAIQTHASNRPIRFHDFA